MRPPEIRFQEWVRSFPKYVFGHEWYTGEGRTLVSRCFADEKIWNCGFGTQRLQVNPKAFNRMIIRVRVEDRVGRWSLLEEGKKGRYSLGTHDSNVTSMQRGIYENEARFR